MMNYEETKELEINVKIKNEADQIYSDFKKYVTIKPANHQGGGKFLYWEDQHNKTFLILDGDIFTYKCNFLHEDYSVEVTPQAIFSAIKSKYRGFDHLEAAVRKAKNLVIDNQKRQ